MRFSLDRVKSFLDYRYDKRPLVRGAALVIGAVLTAVFWDTITQKVIPYIVYGFKTLVGYSVGFVGLTVAAVILGLVLIAFLDTSPTVAAVGRQTRRLFGKRPTENNLLDLMERVRLLEAEVRNQIAFRDQWFEKFTYGYQLQAMPEIGPYDRPVMLNLAQKVSDALHEAVTPAAEEVLRNLRGFAVSQEPETAYLLIERYDRREGDHLLRALERLRWELNPANPEQMRDPRAYLLLSYILYCDWRTQLPRMAEAVSRRLEEVAGYAQWYECHQRFETLFWESVRLSQLSPLGAPADLHKSKTKPPDLTPPPT